MMCHRRNSGRFGWLPQPPGLTQRPRTRARCRVRGDRLPPPPLALVLLRAATLGLAVFLPVDALAQEAAPPQAAATETAEPIEAADGLPTQSLSLEEVQAKLAGIEADAGMDESVKGLLRPKYEQAIQLLEQAAAHAAKAEEYRQAIEAAPGKTAELQAERESLPSPEAIQPDTFAGELDALQRDLEARRGQLEALNEQLAQVTATLARIRSRPVEISQRLSEVERELSNVRGQLQAAEPAETDSPGRTADRVVSQSRARALQNELRMLELERASRSARESLLEARRELLEKQAARAQREVDVLASVVQRRLSQDVMRMATLAETGLETLADGDPEAQALATEVKELSALYQSVVNDLKDVDAAREQIGETLRELQAEDESIRADLTLGAAGGTMAQVLLEWRLQLYQETARVMRIFNDAVSADQSRLNSLEVGAKLRQQPAVVERFAGHPEEAVADLVEARGEVLEKLRSQYSLLIRGLASLETSVDKYRRDAEDAQDYISQQLFWLRSSPPVGLRTFQALPSSVSWLLAARHGGELAKLAADRAARGPIRYGLTILVALALLSLRSRLAGFVTETGRKIRRISTDKYRFTAQALGATLLMAIAVPLLLWMIGGALSGGAGPIRVGAWLRLRAGSCRDRAAVYPCRVRLEPERRGRPGPFRLARRDAPAAASRLISIFAGLRPRDVDHDHLSIRPLLRIRRQPGAAQLRGRPDLDRVPPLDTAATFRRHPKLVQRSRP